ncbi:MAG: hypothetical protein Q9190_003138 [Brigantiaea leucoxantha]
MLGAGLNDVVLTTRDSASAGLFVNATFQQFDFHTEFPWGLYMGSDTNYAGWEFVQLNVGPGDGGFFFNSTGLQWVADYGFGGWIGQSSSPTSRLNCSFEDEG